MSSSNTQFGTIRSFIWPVEREELKKVLPMLLMFFCVALDFNILKNVKDTSIMTGEGSSADAILFVKFWGVLPIAIISTIAYVKLSSILTKQALFYVTLIPFLVFFGLFAWVIYPYRNYLHPQESADYLASILPSSLKVVAGIYRNWTYALFFIFAELWGGLVLNMLFWNFANDITSVSDAKRFYPLFNLGSIFALSFAGPIGVYSSRIGQQIADQGEAWGMTLKYLMGTVILFGFVLAYLYEWIQKNVLTDPRFYNPQEQVRLKQEKPKLSLKDSFQLLIHSKYLGYIALLVIGYGISINLVEITWKEQARLLYPNPNELNAFFSHVSSAVAMANLGMLFLGSYIVRKFGWTMGAMTTPIILFVSGIAFFSFVIFRTEAANESFLLLAVLWGAVQNILSKASKYSLFDPTKEMAYIPLNAELRVKGKAAVDVVGSRLGKSGGSLVQQFLIICLGSLQAIPVYAASIMAVVTIAWMWAVKKLGKEFQQITGEEKTSIN
ncbi:MAG: tlcA-A [Chlamydiales bacterium]|jgi:AAA family ATP:ADP antiporter|nr:tlcA-A [Chlamydiales bacterium]